MTKENNSLYMTVRQFFLEEWDPIGVNLPPEPSRTAGCDEYNNYVPRAVSILQKETDPVPKLVEWFETVRGYFGLRLDNDFDTSAARKLAETYKHYLTQIEKPNEG